MKHSAKSTFDIVVSGVVGVTVAQSEAPGDSSSPSHLLQSSVMFLEGVGFSLS